MTVGELVNHKSNDSVTFSAYAVFYVVTAPRPSVGGINDAKLHRLLWGYYTPEPKIHWIHFQFYHKTINRPLKNPPFLGFLVNEWRVLVVARFYYIAHLKIIASYFKFINNKNKSFATH